jgi:putative addiction module component
MSTVGRGCSIGRSEALGRQFGTPMRWLGPSVPGYDCVVTNAAETLLEQALTLPVEDRALLASGLLASLDSEALDEDEVERLWSAETERRAMQLESGEAELVTWQHLVQRIDEHRS